MSAAESSSVREGELDPRLAEAVEALVANVGLALRGKTEVVRLCVAGLLAGGHLLLEDVPGVGKTTLAKALAKSIDLDLRRIQFTSDMLPSDVVGVSIYDDEERRFVFHPGPIFTNFVLADEINRASPRTQSALLEAMHEGRVTSDDTTRDLPDPFVVIATQNPHEYHGTYPLPESQLDRFLLRLTLGYPDPETERDLLANRRKAEPVEDLQPVLDAATLGELRAAVDEVHADDSLVEFLMQIVQATRRTPRLDLGVSTRAALTTMRAARAHALTRGRGYLLPDDILEVAIPALSHRVRVAGHTGTGTQQRLDAEQALDEILKAVPVPR